MDTQFDVAVIGGGPAGCSTALALARRGYHCLVVEKSDYSNIRIGETFSAAMRRLLVELGLWERFVAAGYTPAHAIHSIWGDGQTRESDAIFDPYGPGWHVDRGHFDRLLAAAAENAGVRLLRQARLESFAAIDHDHWRLKIKSPGVSLLARSRFLVDASGRRCLVARRLGVKRIALDRLIGLVGFFRPSLRGSLTPRVMLVEAVADGWWYSASLPDQRLVVTYMTDADLLHDCHEPLLMRFAQMLTIAPQTARRLQSFTLDCEPSVAAANSSSLNQICGYNWVAVGDAAMTFDPLSSQGVYTAMKYGLLAAQAIARFFSGEPASISDYASDLQSKFYSYFLKRHYYYSREERWSTRDFWRRRKYLQLPLPPGGLSDRPARIIWRNVGRAQGDTLLFQDPGIIPAGSA